MQEEHIGENVALTRIGSAPESVGSLDVRDRSAWLRYVGPDRLQQKTGGACGFHRDIVDIQRGDNYPFLTELGEV